MVKYLSACTPAALCMMGLLAGAQAAPATRDVLPGQYRVEPAHTQVTFSVLHMGFTYYSGLLSGISGTLRLDPAHLAASTLDVSVPTSSIMTTSDRLTGELKGSAWFDTDHYPTSTFTATRIVPSGAGNAAITGNLTLHGVTRPVVLHARFIGAGINPLDKAHTVGFAATATINRSDFGIKTYLPMVGNETELTIAAAFERQD